MQVLELNTFPGLSAYQHKLPTRDRTNGRKEGQKKGRKKLTLPFIPCSTCAFQFVMPSPSETSHTRFYYIWEKEK